MQTLVSLVLGRELVLVGEGTELFVEPIPERLVGKELGASEIGERDLMFASGLPRGG